MEPWTFLASLYLVLACRAKPSPVCEELANEKWQFEPDACSAAQDLGRFDLTTRRAAFLHRYLPQSRAWQVCHGQVGRPNGLKPSHWVPLCLQNQGFATACDQVHISTFFVTLVCSNNSSFPICYALGISPLKLAFDGYKA